MSRRVAYVTVGLGLVGTGVLLGMDRVGLAVGWWLGVGASAINFLFLLSSVQKFQRGAAQKKGIAKNKLTLSFFLRYGLLAIVFLVAFRLDYEQLVSCFLAFISFYIILFIDYLFRLRKQKA